MTNTKSLKVACLQMAAGSDIEHNLHQAQRLLYSAKRRSVELACLPEAFIFRGAHRKARSLFEKIPGSITRRFQGLARRLHMHILLGTIFERSSHPEKCYNTSVLINSSGKIVAKYRKRHLFDIKRKDVAASESDSVVAGNKDVVVSIDGIKVGLSICYDLRFPEFLGRLIKRGAEIILLPSNFTEKTGKAHWEVLCRARAIENMCFLVAPNQGGMNPFTKRRAYGNSLIVDPWGKILARSNATEVGLITALLNLNHLRTMRLQFPTLKKRFGSIGSKK